MFENIGMWEILVLVVAGLFILGPERLPEAARWLGSAVRQVKEYATGAQNHLKSELGPEFDQLQQPLNDLRSLRSFSPRRAITRTLFDDDPSPSNGHAARAAGSAAVAAGAAGAAGAAPPPSSSTPPPAAPADPPRPAPQPLAAGEQPPVDPDAT